MKSFFLTVLSLLLSVCVSAQEIKTYYYNKDGKQINQVFAHYYRVVSVPTETNPEKIFRDFYLSGKIKGEGHYLSIDETNIHNSILDGECVFFNEDGTISKKFTMSDGKLNGTYVEFSDDGKELTQIEYVNGEFATPWYYKANAYGAYGRFRHFDDQPVFDEFNPDAQFVTWIDGVPWLSYTMNGLTISMAVQESNEYGRYHEVSLMIDNATFHNLLIEPVVEVSAYAASTPDELTSATERRFVFSYDDYMEKVENRQALGIIAMAVTGAAAGVTAALTPTTTTVHVNGSTVFVNTYGNPVSMYWPNLAFAGVADEWANDRQVIHKGYLKKNTVNSGDIISGYINVKRGQERYLVVKYNFNGIEIPFYWCVSDMIARPMSYTDVVEQDYDEALLRTYGSDHYTWDAKHDISLVDIKIKKKIRIDFYDPDHKMKGQDYVVVDANGKHEISDVSYYPGSEWVIFYLHDVDLEFPLSIVCTSDPDLSFMSVTPR